MKKINLNKKYNLTYLGLYLFLSTSIGLGTMNAYELVKDEKQVIINSEDNKYVDMHIAGMLDEVDEINIEEDNTNEIVLFEHLEDSYDLENNVYITEEEIIGSEEFKVTTDNKTYEYLEDDDFIFFAANVAAESSDNIYDALAVATSIANRCDSEEWVDYLNSLGMDGENPIDHIKAPGQYSVYLSGSYLEYIEDTPIEVVSACKAVWYDGIRNHNYCSFRGSSATGYSDNQIVEGGNRFNDEVKTKSLYVK